MKIAIAQLNPTIGNLDHNAELILAAAQQAATQNVRLLLTPELSLCGYPPRDLLMQPAFVEQMARRLPQLAQDLPPQMAVLVGIAVSNPTAAQLGGKPLFNSTALLQNGQVEQFFHKRLLPTYDVFDDNRYFEPGSASEYFMLDGLRIGVTICEDLWNDANFWGKRNYAVDPLAELAAQNVDLIINLSGSPYSFAKQQLRESMLAQATQTYGQPILYSNQVGGNDDLIFDGSSVGFNRQGELVCRAQAFESDLMTVEFDPISRDLQPSSIAPQPQDNAEIWAALVLGVKDYMRKCGFSKAMLGLSGGIDSALVAALAAAAVGAENVLGILMPSPYSSDHSVSDALELAQNLGIQTQILPIGELMQSYDQSFAELFQDSEFGLAEENIQSRIRGSLLMGISNKFGHLLISTGNKSELAVGYCTLYGDMNGGLAAIADLPKTRVYALCRWLNAGDNPVIPEHILTKPPSAELKPGQVDQDSLPPYDLLDDILCQFVTQHRSPAEIVATGHEAATVERVIMLVTRAEFKRKQSPPGLKITDRAFGTGWRMPIASRWLPSSVPASPKIALPTRS
ncbi:MAG: NAD+ synthase [Pegethrix bostrychoides GSE-TBD4-15B]|jgi:NAD+ synthetase|uniref:Glutamine-dependent NAD(+) synthetase n=1 Tax=Pegethrix bostrychoides GSE-TBD4-15B TaxID=2839662 RepID=A0A951PE78_9CYAN|nr:NAD+ synthase [Pegethrix bostrychoides GSE-TBD4-15B]